MADYKYLIFDAQYFLTRNFKAQLYYYQEEEYKTTEGRSVLKDDGTPFMKKVPTMTTQGLVKSFYWTIAKFTREIASAEKVILLWDKYPYHKFEFLQDYKGDRHYSTEEDLQGLDEEKDAQQIIDTQYDIDTLAIKTSAKYWIVKNLGKLGMPSFIKSGYEADDYAGIIAKYLRINEPNTKSAIVSIDSDWDYLVQPNVVHLRPRSSDPTTHHDMCMKVYDVLSECNISLYRYKSIEDSLYGSHNNLYSTFSISMPEDKKELVNTFKRIIEGSEEGFTDRALFDAQLKSFEVENYPDYDKVLQSMYYLDKSGSILSLDEYIQFITETGFEVSTNYYMNFVNTLNKDLYGDN